MSEQEYINVSDLARVTSVIKVIGDIVPETSNTIEEEDYRGMLSKLYEWQNELFKTVSVEQ